MKKVLHWNAKTNTSREIEMPDELADHALEHKINITALDAENPFNKKAKVKKEVERMGEAPEKKAKK